MKPQKLAAAARFAAVMAAAFLACPAPAGAVIKVEFPVSKMFDTSRAVIVGTVTRVTPENRVAEVKVADTAKGTPAGDALRIQVANPPDLVRRVQAGQAVVLFVAQDRGGALALLHLADAWFMAERVAGAADAWRVVQAHDAAQSFPGRTVALARVVEALKAGKPALLNTFDPAVLGGGVRELGKLAVAKPTFLSAADVNADKKPDLVVGTAAGVRLFLAAGNGYEDATEAWGLKAAAGAYRAVGDVNADGRPDLVIGKTRWLNDGRTFAAAKAVFEVPDAPRPAAAALADATGDGKPDLLVLLPAGRALVFENPGAADKPWPARPAVALWDDAAAPAAAAFGDWGDTGQPHVLAVRGGAITRYALDAAGGPPADYAGLVGTALPAGRKAHLGGLEKVAAVTLDANGDGRPDFFVVAPAGGLLMVDRGFGAFFTSAEAGDAVTSDGPRKVPFAIGPETAWTAADLAGDGCDDIIVLTEDGRLFAVSNPPPAKH